jgi:hypothetical protein
MRSRYLTVVRSMPFYDLLKKPGQFQWEVTLVRTVSKVIPSSRKRQDRTDNRFPPVQMPRHVSETG